MRILLGKASSGMTMLEVMVGLAVGATVMAVLMTTLKNSSDVQAQLTLNDTISGLEQKIRAASRSDYSLLTLTADANPVFQDCISSNGAACEGKWQPLGLMYIQDYPVDGTYDLRGKRCHGSTCDISVTTKFNGVCHVAGCSSLDTILIYYEIRGKNILSRSGYLTFTMQGLSFSDDNETCGVDAEKRPKFAQKIVNGKLTCIDVPTSNIVVKGIGAGTCIRGKQVIVGVRFDGSIICEDAKFSKKS